MLGFWAVFLAAGLATAWRVHTKLRPMIAADPSLESGGRVLVRTIVVLVLVMVGVNGSLQYFGGFTDPGWWANRGFDDPYVMTLFLCQVLLYLVVLWWVWFANGPARLFKYRAAFSDFQNPMNLGEAGLKWFLTCVPLAGLLIFVLNMVHRGGR